MASPLALLLSLGLDARFGEPPGRVHPVVWMGRYLGLRKRLLGVSSRPLPRSLLGTGFVLVGALGCGVAAWVLTRILAPLPWFVEAILLAVLSGLRVEEIATPGHML